MNTFTTLSLSALLTIGLTSCAPTITEEKTPVADSAATGLPDFDALWNYDDPAGTEARFREVLNKTEASSAREYQASLMTQIARSQGLQQHYSDALTTLNQADAIIQPDMRTARVRSLLERGRVFNSSGKPQDSIPIFKEAMDRARQSGLDFYAVDAAHMLGIAAKGDESLHWSEEAMRIAESSQDERARKWLGALYNNTGWTYSDMGRYQDALNMFEKDFAYRRGLGKADEMGIARWSMASTMRRMGRVEEALKIQKELLELPERRNNENEGYTREEIGECLLALGKKSEAAPFFARAWELLHDDPWIKQDEPKRLERLKTLGGVQVRVSPQIP